MGWGGGGVGYLSHLKSFTGFTVWGSGSGVTVARCEFKLKAVACVGRRSFAAPWYEPLRGRSGGGCSTSSSRRRRRSGCGCVVVVVVVVVVVAVVVVVVEGAAVVALLVVVVVLNVVGLLVKGMPARSLPSSRLANDLRLRCARARSERIHKESSAVQIPSIYIYKHTYIHTYIYIYISIYLYTCMFTLYRGTYRHAHIYICMYVCMYVCTCRPSQEVLALSGLKDGILGDGMFGEWTHRTVVLVFCGFILKTLFNQQLGEILMSWFTGLRLVFPVLQVLWHGNSDQRMHGLMIFRGSV